MFHKHFNWDILAEMTSLMTSDLTSTKKDKFKDFE